MSAISLEDLANRVANLEVVIAALTSERQSNRHKDWRRTIGAFTGDAVMRQIDEAALKFREQDRKESADDMDRRT
jgi:hypothetical protein